ncbi:MAG: hypothetical protein ACRYFV_13715 [Janthinobacterium lividum]
METIKKIQGTVTLKTGATILCEGIPATLEITSGGPVISWAMHEVPSLVDLDDVAEIMKRESLIQFDFKPQAASQDVNGQAFINRAAGLDEGTAISLTGRGELRGVDLNNL